MAGSLELTTTLLIPAAWAAVPWYWTPWMVKKSKLRSELNSAMRSWTQPADCRTVKVQRSLFPWTPSRSEKQVPFVVQASAGVDWPTANIVCPTQTSGTSATVATRMAMYEAAIILSLGCAAKMHRHRWCDGYVGGSNRVSEHNLTVRTEQLTQMQMNVQMVVICSELQ